MEPLHILLTGSTRGIGAAARDQLTREGARVIGHGSRASGAGEVAADLLQPNAAEALWQSALERLDGRIDVLINNAGIYEPASVGESTQVWQERWHRTMQINLQAAADLCRFAVSHFRSRNGGGRIVNVASRAAYRGDSPEHWHYAASKAGLIGITKSIARGFAAEEIYAFAVTPGFTMTGMAEDYLTSRGGDAILRDIPLGRVNSAEEVANAIVYLALQAPPAMTGAVIDINGASYVR
ncbi:MAG TPA: SDR family oxidoreductase [Chthoniobacterales bacterium]|jgi:NAD(P)-dependent dehydrogenase (short-subunit alcohol dehydrogenase family)